MYYFRLTLRNGTHLDYPAGRTVFTPSQTAYAGANRAVVRSAFVQLERPCNDFEFGSEEKVSLI